MDFTKYVWLLESKALFFSRSDLLGDAFEGSYARANEALRPEVYKDKIPAGILKTISDFARWVRQWTFINCWHLNWAESAGMWRLYARTSEAVAIRTTFAALCEVLPSHIFVGLVKYIDYDTEWLPEGNAFYPFLHKRHSFAHENEVRAIWQELPSIGGKIVIGTESKDTGRSVPVDLARFVHGVHVAPTAPDWFVAVVEGVTRRYGFEFAVDRSRLDDAPFF